MGGSRGSTFATFACAASLLLAALLALSLGAVCLSLTEFFYGSKKVDSPAERILLHIRVPRLLVVVLVRAGFSVSSVLIQTVLQNPPVNPGIIGVDTGVGLAVALCIALLPGVILILPFAASLGALASVLPVYGIAYRAGASRITLVLSGVAFSSLMTAGTNTPVTVSPDIMTGLYGSQNGGSEGVSTGILRPTGLVILFGPLVLLFFVGELDVLDPGEITTSSLGLPVRFYRFLFPALATALADAVVNFTDLLGFVGLIVPYTVCFLLKGSGKQNFLLLSALLGAAFSILCNTAARTALAPFKLPVRILIAYLGVLFFPQLLFREGRKRHN